MINFQRRAPEVFYEKAVLKNIAILTGKHLYWILCNIIKKRLQRRCFPVNIGKFSRAPILKNTCKWLLFFPIQWVEPQKTSVKVFLASLSIAFKTIIKLFQCFYRWISIRAKKTDEILHWVNIWYIVNIKGTREASMDTTFVFSILTLNNYYHALLLLD